MKIAYRQSYHQTKDRNELGEALLNTARELEKAYSGFNYATDPDMIDCYIYEINSLLKRYRYLYHCAQELNLLSDSYPIAAKGLREVEAALS